MTEPDTGFRVDLWRARLTLVIVAVAMVAGVALSWALWLPDRNYPLSPAVDGFPVQPAHMGEIWIRALLALLVLSAILPRPEPTIAIVVLLAVPLALWDQSRWQPWSYQYFAMLLCLLAYPWGDPENPRRERVLHALRLIIAFTYLWSGLQKFNFSFASDVFPWLVAPILPDGMRRFAMHAALLPAVIEVSLGAGLLLSGTRPLAVLGLLGMHVGILYCLGPSGHNWNTVVWPWNLAMMLFLVVLFVGTPKVSPGRLLWPGRSLVQWMALILFGVMPAFSFVDRWDHYLSAALYSGNTVRGNVEIGPEVYERLPADVLQHAIPTGEGRYYLDLSDWSMKELNVPVYPAVRIYRAIGESLAAKAKSVVEVHLDHPPNWLTGERVPETLAVGPPQK